MSAFWQNVHQDFADDSGSESEEKVRPESPQCHRCAVRANQLSAPCTCGSPVHDYYVEHKNDARHPESGEETPHAEQEQEVHDNAVREIVKQLERRGHTIHQEHASYRDSGVIVIDGNDDRSSSANVNIDKVLGTPDALRKFVLQVVDEQERREESTKTQLERELDLESGAFKVFVRSTTPSPIDPRRMISSSRSTGSGFLIDIADVPGVKVDEVQKGEFSLERSYIVTNAHVVENAVKDGVQVSSALAPETRIAATVLSVCFDLDIALLRITSEQAWRAHPFRAFPLCTDQTEFIQKFDAVREGQCGFARLQSVFAVGYPLGAPRVQITKGNVSGFQRISDEPVIQITAPINPGNSGGALVDRNRRVLGITSAGIPKASLIGFVIPIQYVFSLVRVANQQEKYGKVIDIPQFGAEMVRGTAFARGLKKYDSQREYLVLRTDEQSGEMMSVERRRVTEGEPLRTGVFIVKLDPIAILRNPVGGDRREVRLFDQIVEFDGFQIDNNGLVAGETYPRKVSMRDLYRTRPFLQTFTVKFARGDELFENQYRFEPRSEDYAVRKLRKEQNGDFLTLPIPRQLVLAPLTVNIVETLTRFRPSTAYYTRNENRVNEQVVVLRDFTGAFYPGEVVTRIDDVDIESIREALRKSPARDRSQFSLVEAVARLLGSSQKRNKFVRIETDSGRSTLVFIDLMFAMALSMANAK